MSLDIHLSVEEKIKKKPLSGIFIRENGQTKEISQEEWDKRNPGKDPFRFIPDDEETDEVFHINITHNLGAMADQAGLYFAMWRPEEKGWTHAKDIIPVLSRGLADLQFEPNVYKQLNPVNGWGNYELLVEVVTKYLEACRKYPDAKIEVSR